MATAPASTTPTAGTTAPRQIEVMGLSVLGGIANTIMQLSLPAVGYGVYESKVDSGNLFKHPFKRARTTLTYLAVVSLGDDEDRRRYRKAVNEAHRGVHSTSSSPVKYNAFDSTLQLWVAACLYRGWEDTVGLYGHPEWITEDAYRFGALLGTTLQLREEQWPATRAEFGEYWDGVVDGLEMDDTIRTYLRRIVRMEFLPQPLPLLLGWWSEITTLGFLPPEFRDLLGMELRPWQRRLFDAHNAVARTLVRPMPRPIREFPLNVMLEDVRWRIRTGRPLI